MNLRKGKTKMNNVYFMDLQQAANVFENFITKYQKATPGSLQTKCK